MLQGKPSGNAVTTRFVWEGYRLLQEIHDDTPLTYVYSDSQSYEPLARIDGVESPEIFWFQCAANGTPELLTDVEGQKTWEGVNSPWGKLLRESIQRIPVVEQNLRMQGQYLDRETGLHYNLFRYYDPDSGRFTQHDPIGLAGGINLYQYAPNALGWVDPLGLSCKNKWNDFQRKKKGAFSTRKQAGRAYNATKGIVKPEKFPDPVTYLDSNKIKAHLSQFEGGVSKIAWGVNPEYSEIGPPGGHFVMPKSVADDVIGRSGGDVRTIEKLLGLSKGELGDAPVRIDIPNPTGSRMPSGNEAGANKFWLPGGTPIPRLSSYHPLFSQTFRPLQKIHDDTPLTYVYSDSQSYEPLVRIDGVESPEIFWFHCAANGTPELLTDAEGQKTWEGVNSPWGKLLRESNQRIPVVEQNLRMQGKYLDRD
nr:type IV secretion protein Rhs [Ipomoea batatas]